MLPLLISLVWLAVVTVVVAACQTAARGEADAEPRLLDDEPPEVIRPGLAVWDRAAARKLRLASPGRRFATVERTRQPHSRLRAAPVRRAWAHRPG